MLKHLNGWQRLFVVISCAWLVVVGLGTFQQWPDSSSVMAKWYRKADRESPTMAAWKQKQRNGPIDFDNFTTCPPAVAGINVPGQGPWCDYQKHRADPMPDAEAALYRATVALGEAERPSALAKLYSLFLLGRLLLWVVPLLVAYFGSWLAFSTARWVVRGFRAPPNA